MPIRIYNTLTQRKEPFKPVVAGKVGMYLCGPTVYANSHIGHMVGPVIFDTIKRYLAYNGLDVTWVVNITDVDDKLIGQANTEGTTVKELAARITKNYEQCLKSLHVEGIDIMPRATEHIDEIVTMTAGLVEKGYAYAAEGDVYFDVTQAEAYGKLSHRDPDELQAGSRIGVTDKKRNPGDFALWKGSKPAEPAWESPWGPGRPGWHIECSAMSMKLLGEHFDIHGGGLDLVFPHHENELVQAESLSGKTFATYWLHHGLLTNKGRKISKSDPETVVLMEDLLDRYDADTIRTLLLSSHYRRPIDFSVDRLDEVSRSLQAFRSLFDRFERFSDQSFFSLESPECRANGDEHASTSLPEEVPALRRRFLDAMDDDFNTGAAIGALFDLVRILNRFASTELTELSTANPNLEEQFVNGVRTLRELSTLLGLFTTETTQNNAVDSELVTSLMELVINLRHQARSAKNFTQADQIRDQLASLGIILEDTPGQTTWKLERSTR